LQSFFDDRYFLRTSISVPGTPSTLNRRVLAAEVKRTASQRLPNKPPLWLENFDPDSFFFFALRMPLFRRTAHFFPRFVFVFRLYERKGPNELGFDLFS
jgi:hypothetical protein